MKLLKRLLQIFKKKNDPILRNEQPNQTNFENKELNVKVAYQYPKGKFRFPLIPDEDIHEKERINQHKDDLIETPHIILEKNHTLSSKESSSVKKKETLKGQARSFRPTEVPSPVYGYKRMTKRSEPVVFELESFMKEDKKADNNIYGIKKREGSYHEIHNQAEVLIRDQEQQAEESVPKEYHPLKAPIQKEEHMEVATVIREESQQQAEEQIQEDQIQIEVLNEPTIPIYEEEDNQAEVLIREESQQQAEKWIEEICNQREELIRKEVRNQLQVSLEDEEYDQAEALIRDEESNPLENSLQYKQETFVPNEEIEKEMIDNTNDEESSSNDQEEEETLSSEEKRLYEWFQKKEEELGKIRKFNSPFFQENDGKEIHRAKEWVQKQFPSVDQVHSTEVDILEESFHLSQMNGQRNKEEGGPARDIVNYVFPSIELLKPPVEEQINIEWILKQKKRLNDTLANFNVGATVVNVTQGPSVTRFEVQPEPGVKVNKITNLIDDIKLSLAAKDIRIEAPIPGKHTIGIEVPNLSRRPVFIREIIGSKEFSQHPSPLSVVLGLDISGQPIVTDIRKMPHGLIAGATGSGKSVCINSIIVSILYKSNPNDVKLLLIDPKMVELAPYNHIPHLVSPVITDVKAATASLKWAVEEMERRYELFAHTGVRDILRFNELAEKHQQEKLPFIVIIIDELADLMMMAPQDVEESICRIAQKARACGIHLIIATQRPSVDVITGLIKANIPTRVAFSVSSQVDSRTIIDMSGAERLLGQGDMLFVENGTQKPVRLQGTYVSDEEIDRVVDHVKNEQRPKFLFEQDDLLKKTHLNQGDELFYEACEFVIEKGMASTSSLQRHFSIGYNRAARLIEMMEEQGLISESKGSKPRDVLMNKSDLELLKNSEYP